MPTLYAAQMHFACEFDLAPAPGKATAWSDVVKGIRAWIVQKTGAYEALGLPWFYSGGKWKPQSASRVLVATERVVGKGTGSAPQYWALRYEHPCEEIPFRQWRTDIGVACLGDGRYHFWLATIHWILPGYIGEEPPAPIPTSPGVVAMVLRSRLWTATAGSEILRPEPVLLAEGQGAAFEARLIDPERRCPIKLVSRDGASGQPMVNGERLARLLAGAATVQVAATPGVDREVEWFLPWAFRCSNGTVRVYQPLVRLNLEADARRHRFFARDRIEALSAEAVEDMIVRGLVRRSRAFSADGVISIDDVVGKRRELRLAELRETASDQSLKELVQLQGEYLTALESDKAGLTARVSELEGGRELAELELIELDERLAALAYERDLYRGKASEAEVRTRILEQRSDPRLMVTLPGSLAEVVVRIQQLWPERIVFTERARLSAKRASFTDVGTAWKCLRSMAVVLHDLIFGGEQYSGTLEQAFLERTGFELTLTETKQTKRDKKLMALREQMYRGEEIDITPHVKYGSKEPKCLRVHYHAHMRDRALVVGHCGDHLDTYGSQWRS